MKKKVCIPKGWYRLRTGCTVRAGDKELAETTLTWHRIDKLGAGLDDVMVDEFIIRRKNGGAK